MGHSSHLDLIYFKLELMLAWHNSMLTNKLGSTLRGTQFTSSPDQFQQGINAGLLYRKLLQNPFNGDS